MFSISISSCWDASSERVGGAQCDRRGINRIRVRRFSTMSVLVGELRGLRKD